MINKLLPEQISSMWPVIKFAVSQSLPPIVGEHPDKMNRILAAMLSGRLEVWAVYDRDNKQFEAILVTKILEDQDSGTKSLLLYCLYGYTGISKDRWMEGYEIIPKYAKSIGCTKVVAYTDSEHLVTLAKRMGASVSTFISLDI